MRIHEAMKAGRLRWFAAARLCLLTVLAAAGQPAWPHAGHDHGPVEAPKLVEEEPRFYAEGEALEAVLEVPRGPAGETATLYLSRAATNSPVYGARVTAELLDGDAQLTVREGETSGAYVLGGLPEKDSTFSVLLDITAGRIIELVTVDGVLREEAKQDAAAAAQAAVGLPRPLAYGLGALNLIVLTVVLLAAVSVRRSGKAATTAPLVLLLAILVHGPTGLRAHAGDTHAGIAPTGSAGAGTHFVPKSAQFSADIRTTEVTRRRVARVLRALGQVEIRADRRAVITPPAEGKLTAAPGTDGQVPVTGDAVAKGQTLLVLQRVIPAGDIASLASDRAGVEGELQQARQQLELARREKERVESLKDVVAASDIDRAVTEFRVAQERVTGLEARSNTLREALTGRGQGVQEITIDAPLTGSVTRSHAVLGEYVRPEKELFEIVNTDEVFVRAAVFESDLARVTSATAARITVEAYPDESFEGTIHALGSELDPQTRSVPVIFNVVNHEGKLRGGMFANLEIETGVARPVLTVPKDSVVTVEGVRHVFVKVGPEVFEARPVEVEQYGDDFAVVTAGLKEKDLVATTGLYQIRMSPSADGQ